MHFVFYITRLDHADRISGQHRENIHGLQLPDPPYWAYNTRGCGPTPILPIVTWIVWKSQEIWGKKKSHRGRFGEGMKVTGTVWISQNINTRRQCKQKRGISCLKNISHILNWTRFFLLWESQKVWESVQASFSALLHCGSNWCEQIVPHLKMVKKMLFPRPQRVPQGTRLLDL